MPLQPLAPTLSILLTKQAIGYCLSSEAFYFSFILLFFLEYCLKETIAHIVIPNITAIKVKGVQRNSVFVKEEYLGLRDDRQTIPMGKSKNHPKIIELMILFFALVFVILFLLYFLCYSKK
jgi:hypothetical protein